jgi:CRP/FNR family transcriptional regulator, cyclic AMP receptor protein
VDRVIQQADQQHLAWLARSFGRPEYVPLSAADLEILIDTADVVSKYPGTHLFKEHEMASAAFLIESGEVEIYRGTDSNRRVVSRVGAGSVLGDIAMFRNRPYLSSAQAVGRVRAFRFDRTRLIPELAQHPAICLRWLVAGLSQLEETQRRVIHLMHKTVLGQVADLLLEEADRTGEVHLSQSTIATLLGVSRQSVNEALGRLRDQKVVETGYRHIRVLNTDRLGVVANG